MAWFPWESLVESLPDALILLDLNGRVLRWNPAAEALFGYSAQHTLGKRFQEFALPHVDPLAAAEFQNVVRTETTRNYQTTRHRKDGTPIYINVRLIPWKDDTGAMAGVVKLVRDNTEHQMLQTLVPSELGRTQPGAWSYTPSAGKVWWGEQTYRIHELPVGTEITLDYALSFYVPEHRELMRECLQRAISDRTPYEIELRVVTASGKETWFRVHGRPHFIDNVLTHVSGTVQDINEQHQSQDALQESEVLFRSLSDNVPAFIWIADSEGKMIYSNRRWMDLIGPSTLFTNPSVWRESIHPDDWYAAEQTLTQAFEQRHAYERTFRMRRKDGTYRWLLERGAPRIGRNGAFVGFLSCGTDITEERELQEKLAASELQLRSTMEHAPVGLFLSDGEANISYANKQFEAITGSKLERCQNKGWVQLLSAADRKRFAEKWRQFVNDEIPLDVEYSFSLHGEQKWFRLTAVVLEKSAQSAKYLGVMQDISQLKLTENRLVQERSYLAGIVSANPDLVLLMSREGEYLDCFIDPGNDLLLDRESIIGKNLRELLTPEMTEQNLHAIQESIRTGKTQTFEYELKVRDELRYYEGRVSRVSEDKAIFSIRNIKARKEAELELVKAKEEAQKASAAKSLFLARMSHELRTPLNGIVGMTGLLLDSKLSEDQQESVQTIRHCSEALLALVNDILDLSKIEAGKLDLEPHPFELTPLIRSSIDMVIGSAIEKSLPIEEKLDPRLPVWVTGDSAKIRQILVNLLGNAVKFTSEGSVRLEVCLQMDAALPSGLHKILFRIEDTGIGIEPERQTQLFSPFQQADASINRRYGGTGLGLAITKSLVEKMGGEIRLSSTPNKGTCVEFSIVVQEQKELKGTTTATTAAAKLGPPLPLRILVAEDNPINQKFAIRLLSKLGYRADLASDGSEAIEAALSRPYDLIFMDLQMPETDGLLATRQIRARLAVEKQPRIIAMTAAAIKGDRERALECGMDDYLCKPVKVEELVRVLNETRPNTRTQTTPYWQQATKPGSTGPA